MSIGGLTKQKKGLSFQYTGFISSFIPTKWPPCRHRQTTDILSSDINNNNNNNNNHNNNNHNHNNDSNNSNNNFNPIMKWKNIPDFALSVHTRILQQLVPTKVYRVLKNQKEQGLDLMCALCHSEEETVPYLLICGCSAIAETIYKAEHDKMLRPITISYYQYIT